MPVDMALIVQVHTCGDNSTTTTTSTSTTTTTTTTSTTVPDLFACQASISTNAELDPGTYDITLTRIAEHVVIAPDLYCEANTPGVSLIGPNPVAADADEITFRVVSTLSLPAFLGGSFSAAPEP